MSAAAFVLTINLFISAIFALAFAIVSAYQRTTKAALWLAICYGLGIFNVAFEFILPHQDDPRLVGVAIFAVFLAALCCCLVGLARQYRQSVPWRVIGTIVAAAMVTIIIIIGWPRDNLVRMVLYQLPYSALMVVGTWIILRRRGRQKLDLALMIVFTFSSVQFLSKPFMALVIGGSGGSPQGYLTSTYAAISQTMGSFLLITVGLLLLLIMVRDVLEEITARSETDKLSGLLNRRGYEDRTTVALASIRRSGMPATVIIADLDHFKIVNDTYGHESGDRVIAAFAHILAEAAGDHFIVGRLGGEEFVAFMPGVDLNAARLFAESVRAAFSAAPLPWLPVDDHPTVSLGVAQLEHGDGLSDTLRRADAALYDAKRNGRDRVRLAPRDLDGMPVHPLEPRLVSSG